MESEIIFGVAIVFGSVGVLVGAVISHAVGYAKGFSEGMRFQRDLDNMRKDGGL